MSVDLQRYILHDAATAEPSTNPLKATARLHDSAAPLHTHSQPPVTAMNNNYDPWAQPFTPNYGYSEQTDDQSHNRRESQRPPQAYMPPASVANPSWNAQYGQPQYPQYNNGQSQNSAAAQQQMQAQTYYYQWAQYHGYVQGFTPINPPQQTLGQTPQRNYPFFAPSFAAVQSQPGLQRASNQDLQYAFNRLYKSIKAKNRRADFTRRTSTPLSNNESIRVVKDSPANSKKYDTMHQGGLASRVDKFRRDKTVYPTIPPTGRSKDRKLMLPAPTPTKAYLTQAAREPSTTESPHRILVILDLNGTLLYRPNRNNKTMIARPCLVPFLRYLFSNFAVMVWSSARPQNVSSLVEQSLEEDLRKTLVAQWAREAFNLKPEHYNANVQVYKNLDLVWRKEEIQKQHPDHESGGRFGQHNTILIDDSVLKAAAQPFNLLQISEFSATPQQMQEDKLRDVAGYLEALRFQEDVSRFIKRQPFQHDSGKWTYEWPQTDPSTQGGELQAKVSMQSPSKKQLKKKNKKAKKREAEEQKVQAKARGVVPATQFDDSGSEGDAYINDGGVKLF